MSRDSSTTHSDRRVTVVVAADRTQRVFGDVEAAVAEPHPGLGVGEGMGEPGDVVGRNLQQVERDPLRRLRPDARQPPEFVDQRLDGWRVRAGHGQERSSISSEPGKASASRSIGDLTDSGGTSTRSSRSTSSSSIGSAIDAHDRRASVDCAGSAAADRLATSTAPGSAGPARSRRSGRASSGCGEAVTRRVGADRREDRRRSAVAAPAAAVALRRSARPRRRAPRHRSDRRLDGRHDAPRTSRGGPGSAAGT